MTTRKPTIFIVHPSDLLTDHRLYGDGLIACGFLRELANRGYRLHVACQEVDLKEPMPGNVTFHPIRQSWPGPPATTPPRSGSCCPASVRAWPTACVKKWKRSARSPPRTPKKR